jgi:hypothetical protein
MGERNVCLAYCLGALGNPWGLIFSNSNDFGMDSEWYRTLEELINEWLS